MANYDGEPEGRGECMKPKVSTEQCELLAWSLGDGQWHKGRTLRMKHRTIRAVCAAEPKTFMSGQRGYKLVKFATIPEMDRSVADLRSRIAHLRKRADALEDARFTRSMPKQGITRQAQLL